MYIESKKVFLRNTKKEDISAIRKLLSTDFVQKYNAINLENFIEFQKNILDNLTKGYLYTIIDKETLSIIGQIGLKEDSLRYGTNTMEIFCFLTEDMANKKIMSELLPIFIKKSLEKFLLKGITARCFKQNIASLKLLEKIGFIKEGELKFAVKAYKDIIYDDCLYYFENN